MARKSATEEFVPSDTPMSYDEWFAQDACEECGSRPGYNPQTGVEVKDGHTYICSKRPKG